MHVEKHLTKKTIRTCIQSKNLLYFLECSNEHEKEEFNKHLVKCGQCQEKLEAHFHEVRFSQRSVPQIKMGEAIEQNLDYEIREIIERYKTRKKMFSNEEAVEDKVKLFFREFGDILLSSKMIHTYLVVVVLFGALKLFI